MQNEDGLMEYSLNLMIDLFLTSSLLYSNSLIKGYCYNDHVIPFKMLTSLINHSVIYI